MGNYNVKVMWLRHQWCFLFDIGNVKSCGDEWLVWRVWSKCVCQEHCGEWTSKSLAGMKTTWRASPVQKIFVCSESMAFLVCFFSFCLSCIIIKKRACLWILIFFFGKSIFCVWAQSSTESTSSKWCCSGGIFFLSLSFSAKPFIMGFEVWSRRAGSY